MSNKKPGRKLPGLLHNPLLLPYHRLCTRSACSASDGIIVVLLAVVVTKMMMIIIVIRMMMVTDLQTHRARHTFCMPQCFAFRHTQVTHAALTYGFL